MSKYSERHGFKHNPLDPHDPSRSNKLKRKHKRGSAMPKSAVEDIQNRLSSYDPHSPNEKVSEEKKVYLKDIDNDPHAPSEKGSEEKQISLKDIDNDPHA